MISFLTSEYVLILVWLGLVAVFSKNFSFTKKEYVIGYEDKVERYYWLFAFLVFFPIIWMAGHRDLWGDTTAYVIHFNNMPTDLKELGSYLEGINKDKGFYFISVIIKQFARDNKEIYFMILALAQGLSIVSIFRKYSDNYLLSVFLFIASTDYISWMFNGIRQFTAVTIIFAATALVLNKRFIPSLLVVIAASTFHQSALIMIPFIIIAYGQAWNKRTLLFILVVLFIVLFVSNFTNLLDSSLAITQYSNVVKEYKEMGDEGTNPIRVLVYSMPTIIAFIERRKIQQSGNILLNFCTNMSMISTGLYIISMFTSGVFLGRLPIYCSLYGYILLPWEVNNIINESNKKWVWTIMIFGYLLFYYYQMHIAWSLI